MVGKGASAIQLASEEGDMSDMKTVWVHCIRTGKRFKSYDSKYAVPLDARGLRLNPNSGVLVIDEVGIAN